MQFFFFDGATARSGPWPPLHYATKSLDPLLCLSIRLIPSFSGPWTRHPAISFFGLPLRHVAYSFPYNIFLVLRCLALLVNATNEIKSRLIWVQA